MRGFFQKLGDGLFGDFIGFSEILLTAAGTNPSERAKTKLKDITHDIFNVGRVLKLVNSVFWINVGFGQRGLVQETVSVVPEFHAFFS